jgi:hypothetical protein
MLPSDLYSQPNAADPVLEERTVLDIVRRHGVRCSTVTREEFVARVRANLAQAVLIISATPNLWQLDVAPVDLASRVLAVLPASIDLVALHSNPGPVHTFVRPDTLAFVGLIDFVDAYISHPALDWRWPTHADRVALLHGYCDETPATDEFLDAWRAGLVLGDMLALATRPEARPQALERLRDLCMTFG